MKSSRGQDLPIRAGIVVPASELEIAQARSGGPGGQNVNKVASKVVLGFRPGTSTAFSPSDRAWLLERLADRLTADGRVVIHSSEHRSVEQNLDAARARLAELIARALSRPKLRRPTRPTQGSKRRRANEKRRQSDVKRARRGSGWED